MAGSIDWDETKRRSNLLKHGLDFVDAPLVLQSPYRLDMSSLRQGEWRTQSFAYVFDVLTVLTLVHVSRGHVERILSFRVASEKESAIYHEWLEKDFDPSP